MSFNSALRCLIVLAAGLAAACADSVRPTDAAPDGDAARDVVPFDAPMGCGESFIRFTYRVGDGAPRTVCAPLTGGGIAIRYAYRGAGADCVASDVEINATFGRSNSITLGNPMGAGIAFASTGQVMLGYVFDVQDRAECEPTGHTCYFQGGAYACPFEIVRTGQRGDLVAARSLATCSSRPSDGPPTLLVVLSDVYVEGRLVPGATVNAPDGSVCP